MNNSKTINEVGFRIVTTENERINLLRSIKADKKSNVKGAVYYESLRSKHIQNGKKEDSFITVSDNDGNKMGQALLKDGIEPDDVNCFDGYEMYKEVEELYKSQGFIVSQNKDVVLEGYKMRMIVFRNIAESKDYGDYFGLAVGYVQARNEFVMYMHYHDVGKAFNKRCLSGAKTSNQKQHVKVNCGEVSNMVSEGYPKKETSPNQNVKNITVFIQGETDYVWFTYSCEEINSLMKNPDIHLDAISLQLAQLLDGDPYTELPANKKAEINVLLGHYVSKLDSYKKMILSGCQSMMITAFKTINGYETRVTGLTKHNINDSMLFVDGVPSHMSANNILLLYFMKQAENLYKGKYHPKSVFHPLMRQANELSGRIDFVKQGNPNLN